ncbi:MAG: 3'(2'),5'-bisphosphate nucleotidase CysQ [Balneolaceae bacterium]|nr:3'(2'),5'-bisphosphate nucleotidase CysQ [Balneolaceae bacterium]
MIENIVETARRAGEATLEYYTKDIEVETKDDDSPLTKADLAAHHIIVGELKKIDPDTPIISEEGGLPDYEERKSWNRFWIVDPLDGTKEFIKKNGEFTVNIALIEEGEPVLGVVYVPAKKVTYFGSKQHGSFKQEESGEPVRIYSNNADTSSPLKGGLQPLPRVFRSRNNLRSGGLKSKKPFLPEVLLNSALLLRARDLYPRMGPTMEWDVAAGDCVFRNSAKEGQHSSPLTYNKPSLKNEGFIIGL